MAVEFDFVIMGVVEVVVEVVIGVCVGIVLELLVPVLLIVGVLLFVLVGVVVLLVGGILAVLLVLVLLLFTAIVVAVPAEVFGFASFNFEIKFLGDGAAEEAPFGVVGVLVVFVDDEDGAAVEDGVGGDVWKIYTFLDPLIG